MGRKNPPRSNGKSWQPRCPAIPCAHVRAWCEPLGFAAFFLLPIVFFASFAKCFRMLTKDDLNSFLFLLLLLFLLVLLHPLAEHSNGLVALSIRQVRHEGLHDPVKLGVARADGAKRLGLHNPGIDPRLGGVRALVQHRGQALTVVCWGLGS